MSAQSVSVSRQDDQAGSALVIFITAGSLLAISVLLSKIAATQNAPMLTYLAFAMGGSGLVLVATGGKGRKSRSDRAPIVLYSFIAGALMALGSALGYLTVHRVGAAFIALALALPPLLT